MAILQEKQISGNRTGMNLPSIMATGDPVLLYDKHATPIYPTGTDDWNIPVADNILVRGEVACLAQNAPEMQSMLTRGRVLATGFGKGIALWQKDDSHLEFFCVIPPSSPVVEVDLSSDEGIRQVLKKVYAGWHHAFHEVFAAAGGFVLKMVTDKLQPISARSL